MSADARTDELRRAHDQLAELYASRLADALDELPHDRAVLGLFRDLVLATDENPLVADVGCGSGWLAPWLLRNGMRPHGVDLSPEMVRVSRRDHPGVTFEVADVRALPFADDALAGAVCWYSLMYLHPDDRARAFAELARAVRPGGYVATGFKMGDDTPRRGGRSVGVEFDIWWWSMAEMERRFAAAGFETVFRADRPATTAWDEQPQGYLVVRRIPIAGDVPVV